MAGDVVEVYWAADAQDAHAVKAMLLDAGIHADVVGELLVGAIGEIPMGPVTSPRVWVRSEDEARARPLVAEWERDRKAEPQGDPWQCGKCDSPVDAGYDLCWSCGSERPS